MIEPGSSALEIARAIGSGEASAADVIGATLERIEAHNPAVNAFPWLREAARADAKDADARVAAGEGRMLEGVPFTAKDLAALADGPTNKGSRAFAGWRAGVDAHVIARLRAAGAILVATTASSEFGARPTTESELFGVTRNPWDLARTPGGSSGGAAVSAALGIAPLNQGSDGGGSLRIPSACCGVVGLKPQRARISLGPLMSEEWGGLDVYGGITRTVADAALFLDVTAGPATGDPYWAPPPERSFLSAVGEDPGRLRIAVAYERDGIEVDDEAKAAVEETARALRELGHEVAARAPSFAALEPYFLTVTTVGIAAAGFTDEQLERIEPRNRLIYEVAKQVNAVDYGNALHAMHLECRRAMSFFDDCDVLLTPTLGWPAPPIGTVGADLERAWDDYGRWLCWTWPFNVTGQPAISIPAGLTRDGIPVGAQLVGRPCAERTILSVAAQLERARPWADRRPTLW